VGAGQPALSLPVTSDGHHRIKSEEAPTAYITSGQGRGDPILCSLNKNDYIRIVHIVL